MDKSILYTCVDNYAPLITALSDRIWGYAELSMEEVKSAQDYCQVLAEAGFSVTEHLGGIPTAFSGSFGSGRPVIGILGEFDALSGLSQEPGITERKPRPDTACGHGCGHNLLGAASLGAAIAVKEQIAAGKLSGTVVFYGCPGEEGCAGKTFLAKAGMFRDLDAALCWHPGDVNAVTTGSNAASLQYVYTFTGTASHAAGAPEQGRSALDAAELMNTGVQYLREHMGERHSVHYAFLDAGGVSPNVVQPTASLVYMVRGETVRSARALLERVHNIARGAALMTDTEVTWKQIDGTASTLSNTVLEEVLQENLFAAPMPSYTPEEWAFAKALKDTYPETGLPGKLTAEDRKLRAFIKERTENGARAINNFVLPYVPSNAFSPGSTDVGDVSWLTPTAQIEVAAWPAGVPGHSWQIVACGKSSMAHKAILCAGKVLAATAIDLLDKPELLNAAKAEFAEKSAEGYTCPIEPGAVPIAL